MTRGDLIDRSLFLHTRPISLAHRRAESEYWRSFRADYPAILGGLLDGVVMGLRTLPSVGLTQLPRMADFAQWGEAVARGLGWPNDAFLKSYAGNRAAATVSSIEDSAVADVLMRWNMRGYPFTGSFADLHLLLSDLISKKVARSIGWPKTTSLFARELRGSRHNFVCTASQSRSLKTISVEP